MGADSVRFKAEVNFDGREVARLHIDKLDLEKMMKVGMGGGVRINVNYLLFQDVKSFNSVEDMEKFLLDNGEQVIDVLGAEVDRIELGIKVSPPN